MNDWSSGYVADIGYTYGYYQELNPQMVEAAFAIAGLKPPRIKTACELGFGQGLSTNVHAAASDVEWYGTDFNPSQAAFARELADTSGNNARLYDEAFTEFVNRNDLPDFDFIGLHGIWSWISDANRRVIVEFVRKKLKVGGVLYVSYNTQPGWASFTPMRHLMTQHAEIIGSEGRGILNRISDALDFAQRLLELEPNFSKRNPNVVTQFTQMKGQNPHYLAHEFFNKDWHPMHFGTMSEWLEDAKVQYACSANFMDHVDVLNLTEKQREFINEIPDPTFRQSVRDFMVNQTFRKDYWVKGVRSLTPLEYSETMQSLKLMLATPRKDVSLKTMSAQGEVTMNEAIYKPILDCMADYKTRTLSEISDILGTRQISWPQIVQSFIVLSSTGNFKPVNQHPVANHVRQKCDALNQHLMSKARSMSDISYLASPVTKGGIPLNRFQQLFVQGIKMGKSASAELADHVWQILKSQDQKLMHEGRLLNDDAENLAELNRQATEFVEQRLPIVRSMEIL